MYQKSYDTIEQFSFSGKTLKFITRPGVFAQYGLDYGSKLLLEQLPLPLAGNVLDLGSGCGFIGITIAKTSPDASIHLIDADIRAVRLTQENIQNNSLANAKAYISDVVQDIDSTVRFNTVVSNPPTHQGRSTLIEFIQGSYTILNQKGSLFMVVNRMTSTLNLLEKQFKTVEKLKKKQGYIVYKATK